VPQKFIYKHTFLKKGMQVDIETELGLLRTYVLIFFLLTVACTVIFMLYKGIDKQKAGLAVLFWLVFIVLFFGSLVTLYAKYKELKRAREKRLILHR